MKLRNELSGGNEHTMVEFSLKLRNLDEPIIKTKFEGLLKDQSC